MAVVFTYAQLRTRWPVFKDVPVERAQPAIDAAHTYVDPTLAGTQYTEIVALTAADKIFSDFFGAPASKTRNADTRTPYAKQRDDLMLGVVHAPLVTRCR